MNAHGKYCGFASCRRVLCGERFLATLVSLLTAAAVWAQRRSGFEAGPRSACAGGVPGSLAYIGLYKYVYTCIHVYMYT